MITITITANSEKELSEARFVINCAMFMAQRVGGFKDGYSIRSATPKPKRRKNAKTKT